MVFKVTQAIFLLLSFPFISADELTNSSKCSAHLKDELFDALDKRCEDAKCNGKCFMTEMGYLNKKSQVIEDEATLTARLASTLTLDLDTARLYAKGFFVADCNRLIENGNKCDSYENFLTCAIFSGCYFVQDPRLENITKAADIQYLIDKHNEEEQIQQNKVEKAAELAIQTDLEKCVDDKHFIDSPALNETMDRCFNATCPPKCFATVIGWLSKESRLIKDEITLANRLKSTSMRELQVARKYAKGFFRAQCNRLIANVNDCHSYRFLYLCATYAGCEFARDSYSTNFTGYTDQQYWAKRMRSIISNSSPVNASSSTR